MNKKEIAAFFDRMAPEWDANMIKSDEKINFILDAAGVKENGGHVPVLPRARRGARYRR